MKTLVVLLQNGIFLKIHSIQNTLACVVTNTSKFQYIGNIASILKKLYSLRIKPALTTNFVFLHTKLFKFCKLPICVIVFRFHLTFCPGDHPSDSSVIVLSIPYIHPIYPNISGWKGNISGWKGVSVCSTTLELPPTRRPPVTHYLYQYSTIFNSKHIFEV